MAYRSPVTSELYLEHHREAVRAYRAADPIKAREQWRKDYKAWYHRQLALDPVGFRKAKAAERQEYRKAARARQAEQDQTSND